MKKIILSIFLGLALVFSAIAFAGCDLFNKNSSNSSGMQRAEIMEIYALAQSNGFAGTYDEWVQSIVEQARGAKGDTGATGAQGPKGDKGVGISKIEKTATNGLVDTYTITFTDETTTTFTITNGKDGDGQNENPQCLAFYPLDDGTYGVGVGNATQLSEITIPATFNGKNVTKIIDEGFYLCNTKTIHLPETITYIGQRAFYGCYELTTIYFPTNLSYIGQGAFSCCEKLGPSISIPNGVTTIESSLFSGCRSLTSITLPESVTRIEDYAFASCNQLTTITVPSELTYVGDGVTADCPNLTTLIYQSVEYTYMSVKPAEEGNFWFLNTHNNPDIWTENSQGPRRAIGTILMNKGIIFDYHYFNNYGIRSSDDLIYLEDEPGAIALRMTDNSSDVIPGGTISLNFEVKANNNSVNFFMRLKFKFKFYDGDVDITDLITDYSDFITGPNFADSWIESGDGWYYYGTDSTLVALPQGEEFVSVFENNAQITINGDAAGFNHEGGGYIYSPDVRITRFEAYLICEEIQASQAAATDQNWQIS